MVCIYLTLSAHSSPLPPSHYWLLQLCYFVSPKQPCVLTQGLLISQELIFSLLLFRCNSCLSFLFPVPSSLYSFPEQRELEQQEQILHYHDSSEEFSNDAQDSILQNIYLYSGKEKCAARNTWEVPLCVY